MFKKDRFFHEEHDEDPSGATVCTKNRTIPVNSFYLYTFVPDL